MKIIKPGKQLDKEITERICKDHGMTDEDLDRIKKDIHFTE